MSIGSLLASSVLFGAVGQGVSYQGSDARFADSEAVISDIQKVIDEEISRGIPDYKDPDKEDYGDFMSKTISGELVGRIARDSVVAGAQRTDPNKLKGLTDMEGANNPQKALQEKVDAGDAYMTAVNDLTKQQNQAMIKLVSAMNDDVVNPERVKSLANTYSDLANEAGIRSVIGAMFVNANMQGGAQMMNSNQLLSTQMREKVAKISDTMKAVEAGDTSGVNYLKAELGDLEANNINAQKLATLVNSVNQMQARTSQSLAQLGKVMQASKQGVQTSKEENEQAIKLLDILRKSIDSGGMRSEDQREAYMTYISARNNILSNKYGYGGDSSVDASIRNR